MFAGLTLLAELDLSNNSIGAIEPTAITAIVGNSLRSLDMSSNPSVCFLEFQNPSTGTQPQDFETLFYHCMCGVNYTSYAQGTACSGDPCLTEPPAIANGYYPDNCASAPSFATCVAVCNVGFGIVLQSGSLCVGAVWNMPPYYDPYSTGPACSLITRYADVLLLAYLY